MESISAIIETPKGSAQKYTFDPGSRLFELKKILPAGMVFPYDFGFIPGTKGEDGDPLDILLISEFKSFPGCMVKCRIIGGFSAEQTERSGEKVRNDRFYGVPDLSTIFKEVNAIGDLPANKMSEIEDFFIQYNRLAGKEFKILKKLNARRAFNLIQSMKQG